MGARITGVSTVRGPSFRGGSSSFGAGVVAARVTFPLLQIRPNRVPAPLLIGPVTGLSAVLTWPGTVRYSMEKQPGTEGLTMLADTSLPVVQATLPVVGENNGEIASRFDAHMFQEHPELLDGLFNRGNQADGSSSRHWHAEYYLAARWP
jgi:hypothetical protein